MIRTFLEHIAYLDDDGFDYDPDEILPLVGLPSGEYMEIKRKNYGKIQRIANWSERLNAYTFRDKDYKKLLYLLDLPAPKEKIKVVDKETYIAKKLAEMKIYSFKIDKDTETVSVNGDVDLKYQTFKKLPFKFFEVTGDFRMIHGCLETLEGFPHKVGGMFDVSYNFLKDLKGGPGQVGSIYVCSHNYLTSLVGAPVEAISFDCSHNKLENLKGAPKFVSNNFHCSHNNIKNIREAPVVVKGMFDCRFNDIKDFKGLPLEAKLVLKENQKTAKNI